MFKIIRNQVPKIAIPLIIILFAVNCSKDQNTFLPYVRVNLYIPLATYNHLTIPTNSVLFQHEGYRGIIVVCVDPGSNAYYAFDACCPYEKDYSGIVTIQPIANLPSQPGTIYSSDFLGICNKCGSKFNLISGGQPIEGPTNHFLQRYNISSGMGSITVSN